MKLHAFFCCATLPFFLCMTNGLDTNMDFSQVVLHRPGHCQWKMATWHKIGESQRCNCMKCTCAKQGEWKCKFSFEYCPYSFCNRRPYNIGEKKCCCKKTFGKRSLGIASEHCFLLLINESRHALAPFYNCRDVKQSYP